MSKVDVSLSDLNTDGENHACFHDLRYTNDNSGGNRNEMTFQINNWSGNDIGLEYAKYTQNPRTGKNELMWTPSGSTVDAVRITIRGGVENYEFLNMLQLILETEKMVEIIKP